MPGKAEFSDLPYIGYPAWNSNLELILLNSFLYPLRYIVCSFFSTIPKSWTYSWFILVLKFCYKSTVFSTPPNFDFCTKVIHPKCVLHMKIWADLNSWQISLASKILNAQHYSILDFNPESYIKFRIYFHSKNLESGRKNSLFKK